MATIRQKLAVEKIAENIRKKQTKPIGAVLKECNYSDSVCKSPQRVTKTQGWAELWAQTFPPQRAQRLLDKMVKFYEEADEIEDKRTFLDMIGLIIKTTPGATPKDSIDVNLSMKRQDIIDPD